MPEEATMMHPPLFTHDCEDCLYLGVFTRTGVNSSVYVVDLYAHERDTRVEYVARVSDEGGDYSCVTVAAYYPEVPAVYEHLVEAHRRHEAVMHAETIREIQNRRYTNA